MGTWGHGLFDDDLALDVKAGFDRAVAGGAIAAAAAAGLMESELAREILEEFSEDDRDDTFWEESRGLFYAIASIQLEHGVLQEVVRQQTLQAIAVERRGLDPEQDRARWELLDALEAKLTRAGQVAEASAAAAEGVGAAAEEGSATAQASQAIRAAAAPQALGEADALDDMGEAAPPRHRLAEGTNPALHIGTMMAKPPRKRTGASAAAKKPAKTAAAKKPAKSAAAKKPAKTAAAKKPARKPAKSAAGKKTTTGKRAPGKPARKAAARKGGTRPKASVDTAE
jgi:hypothetical protein